MSQLDSQSAHAVSLRRMFPDATITVAEDIRVTAASDRSQSCVPGSLFAVIRGTKAHGREYIDEALRHGAAALLVDQQINDVPVPQCIVPDVRRSYAEVCSALEGYPARHMGLAGVTGTNGKTTTTWLIRSILEAAGHQAGLLGTISYSDGRHEEPASLTTPDSRDWASWLGRMRACGTRYAAMELSSHALDQRRTAGTLIDAAVLTNITQDHFDYHGTYEAYRKAKLRIFDALKPAGMAILNADDAGSRSCIDEAPKRVQTYGIYEPADVSAVIIDESLEGTRFRASWRTESLEFFTPLIGRHNVSNCLAAICVGLHFDLPLAALRDGIASLESVPGRLESVSYGQPFHAFVDFAHTPDALTQVLAALRGLTRGKLICVFGAGGDRDSGKRPLMGRAVSSIADVSVVTSDNPRTESPHDIAQQIVAGIPSGRRFHVELDRGQAIHKALQFASAGDCVLIAGKGHETEQIIGTERHHFDDREVAFELLTNRDGALSMPPG